MTNNVINTRESKPLPDREAIRAGLLEARDTFQALLDSVSPERWRQKSPGSKWTIGEIFFHLTWALEYLPEEVNRARRGKGMFNMPLPKKLVDLLSYYYIRSLARKSTPETLRHRYSAAIDATIKTLESVPDSDWELGANFYGEGFYTVADLFRTPGEHLMEHTTGI
jgi:hypothetical protein